MGLEVLFIDNQILVVAKPPGLLTQSDISGDPDLLSLSKQYVKDLYQKPGKVFLGLVHRLDRPASGVMVLARNSKSACRLSEQFRERVPVKRYLAILEGPLEGSGHWRDFLLKADAQSRIVHEKHPGAKEARLEWRVLATRNGLSLAEIELLTGRHHQIRLQFSSRGYPLLGDLRYGAKQRFDGANLALHSYFLSFNHPVAGDTRHFFLAPPKSWWNWFAAEIEAWAENYPKNT